MSTFEEALELTGHGTFNHVILGTCGLILLFISTECLGIGYIITSAECDLHMILPHKGLVRSSTIFGVVGTAIFWGYLGDHFGRRKVMLPALVATVAASVASAMSVNFWNMFLLRILTGGLVSAASALCYVYLAEMYPVQHQASAFAWGSVFIGFSFITMPAFAWAIIPSKWSFDVGTIEVHPWRVYMWSWGLSSLIAATIMVFLPESPRYLLASKGPAAAIAVLAKMFAINNKKKAESYPVSSITTVVEHPSKNFLDVLRRMKHMFKPPLLRCLLISHVCMFMIFLISNGMYMWMPELLNELLNSNSRNSICAVMHRKYLDNPKAAESSDPGCKRPDFHALLYPIALAMGFLCLSTYVLIPFLIVKFGKKYLFCAIVALCAMLIAGSGCVPIPVVAIMLLIPGLCAGCASSILASLTVEAFPTSLRALTLCTLFMVGRLGSTVGTNLLALGILMRQCQLTIILFALSALVSVVTLLCFWPNAAKVRAKMEEKGFTY